jgi:ferredoxin
MTETNGLPEETTDGRARAAALAGLNFDDVTPTSVVEFVSQGRCLVLGDESRGLELARRLQPGLSCVVAAPSDSAPAVTRIDGIDVVRGGRPVVRGALGDFAVFLAGSGDGRDLGSMLIPQVERFDLIVDLCTPRRLGQAMPPLGYYAPGADEVALEATLATLPDMTGAFEKPKFFDYDPEICAHSRSGQAGCSRCINACPAEAIVSIGESIQVNPYLCQGGGSCATTCPTGAITYAYPPAADLLNLLRAMLRRYAEAGGKGPTLLFYDGSSRDALFGPLVSMPESILPVPVEEVGSVGMDAWLVGLAYGAEAVVVLTSDKTPVQVVEAAQDQLVTARALLAGMGYAEGRLQIANVDQVAATLQTLSGLPANQSRRAATFAAPGDKRGRLRLALEHLHADAPAAKRSISLPAGAPFGEVRVSAQACTLCMGCVSVCPTKALQDGRGLPQLNFREWNCVQCGICERTCPEKAISLNARFVYDVETREKPRLLHEEQPVCCISCGKPFATQSMLDVLNRKLADHWMFQTDEAKRRMLMCEDCRVRDMYAPGSRKGA